jgi:hypothetical protein
MSGPKNGDDRYAPCTTLGWRLEKAHALRFWAGRHATRGRCGHNVNINGIGKTDVTPPFYPKKKKKLTHAPPLMKMASVSALTFSTE